EGAEERDDEGVRDRLGVLGSGYARRRARAHASGVRARIAIAEALVIARRRKEHPALAVGEEEDRGFFALQELLDDQRAPRIAEHAAAHPAVDRRHRLVAVHGDDDALS